MNDLTTNFTSQNKPFEIQAKDGSKWFPGNNPNFIFVGN